MSFGEVHLCRFVSGDKDCSPIPSVRGGTFLACFWADSGGQRALPVSALSLLLSAQNNPYDLVAYFGVAYSDPLLGKRVGWEVFRRFRESTQGRPSEQDNI